MLFLGLGWVEITPRTSVSEITGIAVLFVVLVFTYGALPEELAFRGYLQRRASLRQ